MRSRTQSPINAAYPVNRTHPLNAGLSMWLMAVPGLMGGAKLHDLVALPGDIVAGNPGTLANLSSATNAASGWRSALRQGGWGSIAFDGTTASQRVRVPNPTFECAERSYSVAFSFFFASAPPSGEAYFIAKGNAGGTNTATFSVSSRFTNTLNFRAWSGSGFTSNVVSVSLPTVGQWHRGVCVQDAGAATLSFYLDGRLAGSAAKTLTQSATGVPFVFGGPDSAAASSTIQLDDIKFAARAWSAAEVMLEYQLSQQWYPGMLNRIDISAVRRRVIVPLGLFGRVA